jgi:hypothetical protein
MNLETIMKIQTNELTGAALDWAVAKCEGVDSEWLIEDNFFHEHYKGGLRYSTDWAQGGPIIERERILTMCPETGDFWDARKAGLSSALEKRYFRGPTPLVAAMRCYVASKLGDEVDVPQELV